MTASTVNRKNWQNLKSAHTRIAAIRSLYSANNADHARAGAEILLAGETDPAIVITCILAGEALPDPQLDITSVLCKVRDLFSGH